jgi:thymidylate synthase
MTVKFDTFQQAYAYYLRRLLDAPEYVNAPRGRPSREILSASYSIADPVQRHLLIPERRPNYVFNFAEALWYLSGSDSLAPIAHYAPSIAEYSADGRTLAGTAYGRRIFRMGDARLNQWQQVRRTLAEDPDSKRAVIQLFEPGELADPANIDVACTLALQFLIRDDKLSCVAFMRANDCYRGMVSDVFSFSLIQELMAREFGVGVGPYYHCAGSLHVYESDLPRARKLPLDGEIQCELAAPDTRFPTMPAGDNWPHVRALLRLEQRLRANASRLSCQDPDFASLSDYWRQVALLLEAYRAVVYDDPTNLDVLTDLHPLYRWSLSCRWPECYAELVRC